MEADLVIGLALAGITLGIVEGVKPGPLLTTVIKETLTNGFKGGIRAASAPFFTDGPLILFSIFMAGYIADQPLLFCGIAVLGAIFLTRMGMGKALQLKNSNYLDFYPVKGGFKGVKNRPMFENLLGPTSDYLHSIFHILQATGNEKIGLELFTEERINNEPFQNVNDKNIAIKLTGDLRRGNKINPKFIFTWFACRDCMWLRYLLHGPGATRPPVPTSALDRLLRTIRRHIDTAILIFVQILEVNFFSTSDDPGPSHEPQKPATTR